MESVKQSLDSIFLKYEENNQLSIDLISLKEVLHSLLHADENYFSESDLINHRLFVTLRDWYLNLLQRSRLGEQADETSSFVFQTIPSLFLRMSQHVSDKNLSKVKQLILYEPILNEINVCLQEILSSGKGLRDPQIKSLDGLLRVIQHLEKSHFVTPPDPLLSQLFDKIVECVCSTSFIEIFHHFNNPKDDDVDPRQSFLLNTCIDYICFHSIDQQTLLHIRQSLLRPFSRWLTEKSISFRLWNNRTTIILRQLSSILTLTIQYNRHAHLEQDTFNYFCRIIDSLVNILYSLCDIGHSVHPLMTTLTLSLCAMTLSEQLEKYLRSKHVAALVLKLANIVVHDEIRLNLCRILSAIITERDAKNLSNSATIAHLFVTLLNRTTDDSIQSLRFHHLLRCLKKIIFYDQIKNQLVEQNVVTLLLRCATETKVQQPALEILLALSFNNQANRQLEQDLVAIQPLLSSSHPGVSRAADALLWRLEKQEEILSKPKPFQKPYVMISYSYSDSALIDRIYDQLLKDNVRVWIDRNEPYGTSMTTKASVIDQSQCILMCLSDQYERNSYCRCEVDYINQRQCQIIPLVSTLNYHPNGWLADSIKDKIYVDFSRTDFDIAYHKLRAVMNRMNIPREIEYPSVLAQWTNNDVKSFVIEKNFECFLPIVRKMNGHLLNDLYTMCRDHRQSMFHTFKDELVLAERTIQPLTLPIYLRFLDEIQRYTTDKQVVHN